MKQLIKRFLKEQVDTKKVKVQTGIGGKILIIDADTHDVYRYELSATGKFLGVEGSTILSATSINIISGSITIKLPKKGEEDGEVINEIIPQNIISEILSTYNKDENPKSFINIMDIEYGKPKINLKLSLKFIDKTRATPRTNESYKRFLKEETSRQTKVISIISNLGLVGASKIVGGYKNLVNILKGTDHFKVEIDLSPFQLGRYALSGDRKYGPNTTYYQQIVNDPSVLMYDDVDSYSAEDLITDLNEENINYVKNVLSKESDEDLRDTPIDELLDWDNNDTIGGILRYSADVIDRDAYGEYLQGQLIKALEEFGGEVTELNSDEVKFTVDMGKYLSQIDDKNIDNILTSYCDDDDLSCLFIELIYLNEMKKSRPYFDEYWYNRSFDEKDFNEIFTDKIGYFID
jgi:hypothetical protein